MKIVLAAGGAMMAVLFAIPMLVVVLGGGMFSGTSTVQGVSAASATLAAYRSVCWHEIDYSDAAHLSDLDEVQSANAAAVIAVATGRAGWRGALVAIATVAAESNFYNLGNSGVSGSDAGEGMGSDHDSVGLFQQRPSQGWGEPAQLLDPVYATNKFLDGLLTVSGWEAMPVEEAAQAVQRSAFTGDPKASNGYSSVVGENYLRKIPLAEQIIADSSDMDLDEVRELTAGERGATGPAARPVACDEISGDVQWANSDPTSFGLPADYEIPEDATGPAAAAIAYAIGQLGKPYVWAGAGPDSYDCSGLTMMAWQAGGVRLDHFTGSQATAGTEVGAVAGIAPGDLVFVPGSLGTLAAPRHVGIYIGHGLVANAASTDLGILVQTFDNYASVGGGIATIRNVQGT